ncbi:TetR/AcrR family transcriptional regulator [Streptantibioticus ferralitis]|uniref:TetR/AcrR family transcriptional regulator n=1 Tax=Streptantibioticus ferralitis TaxID=236510 RepID=A0ABT5ZBR4_9ACTN|nr:TetR/AcrR family transcriptional regulator [Streptantibioticus ferralitis]MDF2261148.1 TetR/AcrR family transcriptional regulator [Streptantibioticus ferralitis]
MAAPSEAPQSRRERRAKPALSRAGIVATSVALVESEGLERVTMRRLAQELDTGPASLYVYFRNTAELHAAVLDELLGKVDLGPVADHGPWRERLIDILTSYIQVLYEYPSLARSALVARPRGEHYLALLEGLLTLLKSGGIDGERAGWAVDLLLQFATTAAAEHGSRRQAPDAQEDWTAFTEALRSASPERYPHLAATGDDLFTGAPGERRTWIFQVLLNGILTAPAPDAIRL